MKTLGDMAIGRPGRILLIAGLVSLACLAISRGLPERMATQGFANEKAESQKALEAIAEATGYDPNEDIVAIVSTPSKKGINSPDGRARTAEVAEQLAAIDGVQSVIDPLAPKTPKQASRAAISSDGQSALVTAHTAPHSQDADTAEQAVATFADDPDVKLGGSLVTQYYISTTISKDLKRSEMIAFPLLFLISLFVFRSLLAALLPLLIGAITIPLTLALLSFYNELTSLSVFALNLTTGLGLGLAIDYALLTITRYREQLALGDEPDVALRTTIATAGRTIVYSALTVAGAILVLAIFPLKFLYSMALAGSTVAIVSAVVSVTVLPAVLKLLGPHIDRFSVSRRGPEAGTERWYGLARAVMRRPLVTALLVTGLIAVLMLPMRGLSFTSVDATVLPEENQAHVVQIAQTSDFPQSQTSTITVAVDAPADDPEAASDLARQVEGLEGVAAVSKPSYLGSGTWQFNVQTDELFYAEPALTAVEDIRALDSPAQFKVGGFTAVFVDQRATILGLVPEALALILAITFVVLFLMTGSVVLPIKTFIMNLLTLGATFGILTWIFGQGHLEDVLGYKSQDALELTQPVLLFVIAFALATDYGVFLLGRIKELRDQGMDDDEAVAQGLARTGRVITSAALLFCVAIGSFSLSGIIFIKQLGIGTALAVAIDATLIRALLVPALMAMLGRYNWWAPRWMVRLHGRIGLSEGPSARNA